MKFRRQKEKLQPQVRRQQQAGTRPVVFSYYARGNTSGSESTARNTGDSKKYLKPKPKLVSIPSYMAFVIMAGAVIYALILQPNARISVPDKAGTIYRSPDQYQKAINSLWRRSILNRTKLTVRSADIERDIRTQFAEINTVKIELPLLGHRPAIFLEPAKPALKLISRNGSFYLDEHGKVLARTTEVNQNQLDLPLIIDESAIPAEPGKSVIADPEAQFLHKLSEHLTAEQIQYESIVLPATAAKEADVRLAGQKYILKFSVLSDPRQAVGSYIAIRDKLSNEKITPAEYIDLRVEEKIFYK